MNLFAAGMGILILGKTAAELWLARLNQRHVRDRANTVPDAFKESVDAVTYADRKSVV